MISQYQSFLIFWRPENWVSDMQSHIKKLRVELRTIQLSVFKVLKQLVYAYKTLGHLILKAVW